MTLEERAFRTAPATPTTVITAYAQSPVLLTLGITLAAVWILSALPRFWAGLTSFLSGTAAAAGIALIAVLGNLGGYVGPAFTGGHERCGEPLRRSDDVSSPATHPARCASRARRREGGPSLRGRAGGALSLPRQRHLGAWFQP